MGYRANANHNATTRALHIIGCSKGTKASLMFDSSYSGQSNFIIQASFQTEYVADTLSNLGGAVQASNNMLDQRDSYKFHC